MKEIFPVRQYSTFKCETFCAELINNGIPFSSINIQLNGSARKRFSEDIEMIEPETGPNGEDIQKITVRVNRDGLYDLLPEGLFHLPAAGTGNTGIAENRTHHRKLKEEEKTARKFFQPFEQEFMHYACQVELLERATTQSILSGDVLNSFNTILDIPQGLPAQTGPVLAQLMPWAYWIKSSASATAAALKLLLRKPVTLHRQNNPMHRDATAAYNTTNLELGSNFVLNAYCNDPVLEWTYNIHDIEPAEMALYTAQQPYHRLLAFFTEVFIPVEVEVTFNYHLKNTTPQAIDHILGYGSVL